MGSGWNHLKQNPYHKITYLRKVAKLMIWKLYWSHCQSNENTDFHSIKKENLMDFYFHLENCFFQNAFVDVNDGGPCSIWVDVVQNSPLATFSCTSTPYRVSNSHFKIDLQYLFLLQKSWRGTTQIMKCESRLNFIVRYLYREPRTCQDVEQSAKHKREDIYGCHKFLGFYEEEATHVQKQRL